MSDDVRPIDCKTAMQELWDYLDQELDSQAMAEVRQHLTSCRDCFSHADFDKRFLEALGRVKELHLMPAEVRKLVMAALAKDGLANPD